jgi:hypothetical protein
MHMRIEAVLAIMHSLKIYITQLYKHFTGRFAHVGDSFVVIDSFEIRYKVPLYMKDKKYCSLIRDLLRNLRSCNALTIDNVLLQ